MYVGDIITLLDRHSIRLGNVDYYPKNIVLNELEHMSEACIKWDEEDFRAAAIEKSNEIEWNVYYDENTFSYALTEMIRKHDASIGITWDTVYYYLDEYCKLKDYKNIYNSNKILK